MGRLVVIDDDETELDAFRGVVGDVYDYTPVHWPHDSAKLHGNPPPDTFVSDLYLPSPSGDTSPTVAQRDEAARAAKLVGERFLGLYSGPSLDDKARLQETMKGIVAAYDMLRLQWSALGQSPDHGVALLTELRARYPAVPFVFYSRKITPEDVIRVLRAGAADAIRKGVPKEEVLARLANAQELYRRQDFQSIGARGFNLNITLASGA